MGIPDPAWNQCSAQGCLLSVDFLTNGTHRGAPRPYEGHFLHKGTHFLHKGVCYRLIFCPMVRIVVPQDLLRGIFCTRVRILCRPPELLRATSSSDIIGSSIVIVNHHRRHHHPSSSSSIITILIIDHHCHTPIRLQPPIRLQLPTRDQGVGGWVGG